MARPGVTRLILAGFAATMAGSLIVTSQGTAAPAPTATQRAKVLQALVDCRKLTADAERLACYDRSTAVLDEAEKTGEVVVVDQAKAREVRRQAFGFNLPSLAVFNRNAKDEAVEKLETTIDTVRERANGRFSVTTTDGALWVQTDGDLSFPPVHGQPMTITPAMLGSYFCKFNHQPAVRCKREN